MHGKGAGIAVCKLLELSHGAGGLQGAVAGEGGDGFDQWLIVGRVNQADGKGCEAVVHGGENQRFFARNCLELGVIGIGGDSRLNGGHGVGGAIA